MLYKYIGLIKSIGVYLVFPLFFFIGMAIKDVLKQGNVPPFGQKIVWLALFLGFAGFITKGIIQRNWEGTGI